MDINEETESIKKKLADMLIAHLKENKITPEKAKQLANDFLNALPIQDQKDLLTKLEKLGESYNEAKEIYVEELGRIEEEKAKQTLVKMRQHIQTGNVDKAVETARSMVKGSL